MLVLTRKKGEKIVLGDGEVIITLLEIIGDKVRIGIEADRKIPVHRMEIYKHLKEDGKSLTK